MMEPCQAQSSARMWTPRHRPGCVPSSASCPAASTPPPAAARLTPSQLSVLGSIARQGPLRLSDLAEIETLNPTMLSRIVANLDDAGLVHRRCDPDDRRAGLVEVTASGRRTHDRLRAQRATVLLDGLHALDHHDVAAVEAALPALEQLVEVLNRR